MDLHLFMKFKTAVIEQDITLNHCGFMILHKLQFYKLPKEESYLYIKKAKLRSKKTVDAI